MLRKLKVLAALCLSEITTRPGHAASGKEEGTVIAIDILMEPDATMIQQAEAVNARLRSVYSKGFALDASHRPHISMFQCFIRTADLKKVYAVAAKVFAGANVTGMKLKAFKYYYIQDKSLGLSGDRRGIHSAIDQATAGFDCRRDPIHGQKRDVSRVRHHARGSGH